MIKNLSLFDDDGTLIRSSTYKGTVLKKEWFVMYKEGLSRMLTEIPNFATLKVFLKLCSLQTYEPIVVTSTSFIAKELGIAYKTAWESIKWLTQHNYVKRTTHNGLSGFLLNLDITTCGKSSYGEKQKAWALHNMQSITSVDDNTPVRKRSRNIPDVRLTNNDDGITYIPPDQMDLSDCYIDDDEDGDEVITS